MEGRQLKTCIFCGAWLFAPPRKCSGDGCENEGCERCLPYVNEHFPQLGGKCCDCLEEADKETRKETGRGKP